jgi:hypothetical protein
MTSHDQDSPVPGSGTAPFQPASTATLIPAISGILQRTQPWTRLMGILGFVSVAFMMVGGAAAGAIGLATQNSQAAVLLFVYPLLAVLYIFPSMYLVRYSKRIREFVAGGQQTQLEAALEAQRSFWKFVGVLSLAAVAVTVLGVVLAIAIPLMLAFAR